jgi:rSAM/selenodomain-associated transferase 2
VHPPRSISVVVPTLNEQPAIAGLLDELCGEQVERIVVDGGSDDGTVSRARERGAERVVVSEPGRGRQMQAGFRASSGEAILFLHADTRLDPGWADAVRRALADPGVAGGAFRLRFESERLRYRWLEFWVRVRCRTLGLPYGDQALFVRRSVLEAAGGVPQVPIFEDLDLARLISRAGRLALLLERATTSPRRYEERGVASVVARNAVALLAYGLGLDRERVSGWYRGRPRR